MQAFVNANPVPNFIDQKFIYKYIFIIFGDIIYFNNTKQRFIISSIIKAEYIALSLDFY